MKIKAFGVSDVGKKREKNEDSFLINRELGLYIVADGMGGHLGGGFASKLAVSTIEEVMKMLEEDPETTLQDSQETSYIVRPGEFQSYIRYAVKLSSQRIFERANTDLALHGMGTTTVLLYYRNNKVYIANVGDSRAYRIRGGKINQITKDHSLVGEQIRAGILTEADAKGHRLKNIITRSVGFQDDVEADIDIRVARVGDRFLLCSDGLSNMLQPEEIKDIVVENEVDHACKVLIDVANERGGDDNISVVITEVESLDEDERHRDLADESTMEL